jgi:hypothetical protein
VADEVGVGRAAEGVSESCVHSRAAPRRILNFGAKNACNVGPMNIWGAPGGIRERLGPKSFFVRSEQATRGPGSG